MIYDREPIPLEEDMLDKRDIIYEETGSALIRSTWPRIRARVKRQHITAQFVGLKANGEIIIRTTSGTSPSMHWMVTIRFKSFDRAQKAAASSRFTKSVIIMRMLLASDIQIHCNCPCWNYYCAYAATLYGYGIKYEGTPSKIRNPKNEKLICKHCVAALKLLVEYMTPIINEYKGKKFF